jgi:hypothetical protein
MEIPVEPAFSLSPEQRQIFERDGMLSLPGFVSRETIAPMLDALWEDMRRRFSIYRDRPETWAAQRPAQFQALVRSGAFDALGPRFTAIADYFLGPDTWERPPHFGGPLVTFPTGAWDVPHNVWHLDIPAAATLGEMAVIRTFVFLDTVRPRGGGTCYVEGSHRVVMDRARQAPPGERLRSAEMKTLLQKEEPWFTALFTRGGPDRERRFMVEGGEARGIRVRVRELTGAPGDAFIMHPAMLHTIAPNERDVPRLMLVQALNRHGAYGEMVT